jgi:hypothetical protein
MVNETRIRTNQRAVFESRSDDEIFSVINFLFVKFVFIFTIALDEAKQPQI